MDLVLGAFIALGLGEVLRRWLRRRHDHYRAEDTARIERAVQESRAARADAHSLATAAARFAEQMAEVAP